MVMQAIEWMPKSASQFAELFSLSRAFYSVIIIFVIVLLAKSLVSTWQIGKITVGEFDYFADGEKKENFGRQIRAETFEFYNLIVSLIQQEAERTERWEDNPDEERDNSERLPAIRNDQLAGLGSKSSELQQLEITVQGINIRNIFAAAGNLVAPRPRELTATIFSSNSSRRVFVTAPSAESRWQERPVPALISGGGESDTATAFRIACYMIWSQWDAASSDGLGVNFSEFCRVARLLYIRNTFDALPSYEFQKAKFKDEVDFLKDVFLTAALAKPSYDLIYSSLGGLQSYVGDENIDLTSTTSATIDSVVDLIALFSRQAEFYRRGNWTTALPAKVTDRKTINRHYFNDQMKDDCAPGSPSRGRRNIPDNVRSQFDNVVRIVYKRNEEAIVRTGVILADEAVITVGTFRRGKPETLPDNTEIQLVRCGSVVEAHKMKAASAVGASPYLRLVVPGLKLKAAAPSVEDASVDEGDALIVVGHLRRLDGLFRGLREISPAGIDNDVRQVFLGQRIRKWSFDGASDDGAERFDLDIPFGAGMVGSPVFSRDGKLIGLLGGGQFISPSANLSLCVGVSAKPLVGEGRTQ